MNSDSPINVIDNSKGGSGGGGGGGFGGSNGVLNGVMGPMGADANFLNPILQDRIEFLQR